MKLKLRENADINVVTGISDIIIDSINKKWDNIRDFNSIIVNLNEEGYEDLVPVIQSVLEDENKNVGKLQQLIELISPNASSIDDGKQEAIDELDNNEIKVEEMKLDENFPNVPEKTTTVVDPVFGKAIEDHDKDEKEKDDAFKENEKLAKETIPKEGETGKKVTSPALKAMHLSESLFDEELDFADASDFKSDVYNALVDVGFKWRDKHVSEKEWEYALEWFELHFFDSDDFEDLNEGFEDKKKELGKRLTKFLSKKEFENRFKISDQDKKEFIARVFKLLSKYYAKDEKISADEVSDLVNRLFKLSFTKDGDLMTESIKLDIAKEQIKRFKEGKMPKGWSPEDYVKGLVSKNHLTKEEGDQLLSEGYDDINSIDDFKHEMESALYSIKQAYHELANNTKDSFENSAYMINLLKYNISKLDDAMQKYEWDNND